jgi:glycosyltransferase involved in cell wall biosynthesis
MRTVVVIPVYNEARWVRTSVRRLLTAHRATDLVLVDDGSTDGTRSELDALAASEGVHTARHETNRGKGAAIRTGIGRALSLGADAVLIHDADLEYDPADHAALLAPIVDGRADAVIGSRFIGQTHRVLYYWHFVANQAITTLCNMATNLNLTDVECCCKAFTRQVLERMELREERFGIEIELIAKVAKARLANDAALMRDGAPATRRARIYEVPVSYAGRTYEEGKKITWQDGLAAVGCIARYGLFE